MLVLVYAIIAVPGLLVLLIPYRWVAFSLALLGFGALGWSMLDLSSAAGDGSVGDEIAGGLHGAILLSLILGSLGRIAWELAWRRRASA